jgi:prophage regulatory protein
MATPQKSRNATASVIDLDNAPDSAFVRQSQLLAGAVPFGKSTLWRRIKAGTFPQPHRFADGRITAWRVGDIRAYLETQAIRGDA